MLISDDFVFALPYFQSQASHPKGDELINGLGVPSNDHSALYFAKRVGIMIKAT